MRLSLPGGRGTRHDNTQLQRGKFLANPQAFFEIVHRPITSLAAAASLLLVLIALHFGDVGKLPTEWKWALSVGLATGVVVAFLYGMTAWFKSTARDQARAEYTALKTAEGAQPPPSATELKAEKLNELVYSNFSILYGLAYEELLVHGELDEQGGMRVWRDSKVRAHVAGIGKLDHYLLSEAPDKKDIEVELQCHTRLKQLTKEIQRVSSRELYLMIGISEPLMPNEGLHFTVIEKAPPKSVAMSQEELQERVRSHQKPFPYESFFWTITRPTKHFQLKLIVPEHLLSPEDARFDVWFGPSRISHTTEFKRIHGNNWYTTGRVGERLELCLDVMFPISTLIYAIRWVPTLKTAPGTP